jgi:Zn-dependent protease
LPFGLDPVSSVMNLIVLVLSLTVHEFFHAWSAWKLGDDTAAREGRLTLNPIPHIDVFGTLILPLMNAPIGWAKPVPVNPARFRRGISMSTGDIIVSAAGPLSNIGLGLVAAVVWGLLARFAPETVAGGTAGYAFLDRLTLVNAGLAVFNLLPIPPLDGGHVAGSLIPYRWRPQWDSFAQYAPFVLMLLIVVNMRTGILSMVLGPPRGLIVAAYDLVAGLIAG